jgi:hypothetical protein
LPVDISIGNYDSCYMIWCPSYPLQCFTPIKWSRHWRINLHSERIWTQTNFEKILKIRINIDILWYIIIYYNVSTTLSVQV